MVQSSSHKGMLWLNKQNAFIIEFRHGKKITYKNKSQLYKRKYDPSVPTET